MTNHVHLAIEAGPVPLSRIVLALHGSYAQAFNQRHERVGHLFQGRYKALLVQKTSYLLALVRYIHENPVKAGIVSEPRLYRWSSERFYRGERAPDWLDTDGLLELLGADPSRAARRYRAFMRCEPPEKYEDLKTFAHIVKGDEEYARSAFEKAGEPERPRTWSVEQIVGAVASRVGVGVEEMRSRPLSRQLARARAMTGYIASKHGRIPLTRAAEFFRRDGTTLVKDLRRLEAELEQRAELREDLAAILEELDSS
jgi:hypothetical protein